MFSAELVTTQHTEAWGAAVGKCCGIPKLRNFTRLDAGTKRTKSKLNKSMS